MVQAAILIQIWQKIEHWQGCYHWNKIGGGKETLPYMYFSSNTSYCLLFCFKRDKF